MLLHTQAQRSYRDHTKLPKSLRPQYHSNLQLVQNFRMSLHKPWQAFSGKLVPNGVEIVKISRILVPGYGLARFKTPDMHSTKLNRFASTNQSIRSKYSCMSIARQNIMNFNL